MWAILSQDAKRGGAWDLDEFLASGRTQAAEVLQVLDERGIAVRRHRALDFGCGIGRATQALAEHFDSCDGVDIAPSMVETAARLNQHGARCRFHHNPHRDLRLFGDGSFDFILAMLVMQHMEPRLMKAYLREFIRVLRPGGIAYFNVPEQYVIGTKLPSAALRAAIALVGEIPTLTPGQVLPIKLRVQNMSEVAWPTSARLVVGNHWLSADGELLAQDDGRAPITEPVEPGGNYEVELPVAAPQTPGTYQLEVDLVQELVGWFAAGGSRTLQVSVDVTLPDRGSDVTLRDAGSVEATIEASGVTEAIVTPRIEMHAMSRREVVRTIKSAGGAVLDVFPLDRCGPSAQSLDYLVTRTTPRRFSLRRKLKLPVD